MSVEREREPVLNSGLNTDPRNRSEELQAKLDRLNVVIAREKELNELSKLEQGDPYGEELSAITELFLDTFFEFATRSIEADLEFSIITTCTEHMLLDYPDEYCGTIEVAIDTALQEAIDEATTPHQTGLLALARYRIESQRRQLAGA